MNIQLNGSIKEISEVLSGLKLKENVKVTIESQYQPAQNAEVVALSHPKRVMSAATRRAISKAQKAHWAKIHGKK